ncbi:MAG: YibE/F family protein [Anaerolineae bacterium]|nr:YibE/F family protein [Anaerolineae bacterium]
MSAPIPPPAETQPKDPFDLLVEVVPLHIWVSLGALTTMLLLGLVLFRSPTPAPSSASVAAETQEGRIVAVLSMERRSNDETTSNVQKVLVEITRGSERGKQIEIEYGDHMVIATSTQLRQGDRVLIEHGGEGPFSDRYFVSDFVRLPALLVLILVFAALTVTVGQWTGLRALVSIGFSVLALAGFFIPGFTSGYDPLLVAVVGSILLMTSTQYLIYKWRWKTHTSLLGMIISLVLASAITLLFGRLIHLTGLGSEDAVILLQLSHVKIDAQGLLWAGILIGAVGVLDDVAVGQASATFELKRANPDLGWRELFRRAMVIGRDHIASLVNTLLLAYVGASLPLFLLLAAQSPSLGVTLNREFLAEEIVRTLVGSLVLIAAVPITSLIAGLVADSRLALNELQTPPESSDQAADAVQSDVASSQS